MKMMKKIKIVLFALLLLGGTFSYVHPAAAYDPLGSACSGDNANTELCKSKGSESTKKVNSTINTIVNTLLFFVGLLSVIMIIVSGILYTTSGGDTGKVTRAKSMLTYAIVGLVVAFLAFAIVKWVMSKL